MEVLITVTENRMGKFVFSLQFKNNEMCIKYYFIAYFDLEKHSK